MSNGPSAPSERSATNRSWRIWATVSVVAIAAIAGILGFVVLPAGNGGMAEAMGDIHHVDMEWQATVEGYIPPTEVAWTVETLNAVADGDADNGAVLAGERCASCHGAEGVSASPAFPSLAGQPATATYKQLRDFASGHRVSPIMAGMAQGLDDQQMIDIARFYASRDAAQVEAASGDLSEIEALALNGDPSRGLPSCDSCHAQHGPRGTPNLDGLTPAYIAAQLQAFAAGARGNDIYGLMRTVAGMLTPEEINALAAFYGI